MANIMGTFEGENRSKTTINEKERNAVLLKQCTVPQVYVTMYAATTTTMYNYVTNCFPIQRIGRFSPQRLLVVPRKL